MKTIAGPCAAEPGMPPPLNLAKAFLGSKSRGVIVWMIADIFAECQLERWLERRVEADEQRPGGFDALQLGHPEGDGGGVFGRPPPPPQPQQLQSTDAAPRRAGPSKAGRRAAV